MMMMWERRRMRKMMLRVMKKKMMMTMRSRVVQARERQKMMTMMTRMMLEQRSRKPTMIKSCVFNPLEAAATSPRSPSVFEGNCGHHQVEFNVHVHTRNCKFFRKPKTSKFYLLNKIQYFKMRICLYFYLHFIFLYILLGGQPFFDSDLWLPNGALKLMLLYEIDLTCGLTMLCYLNTKLYKFQKTIKFKAFQ